MLDFFHGSIAFGLRMKTVHLWIFSWLMWVLFGWHVGWSSSHRRNCFECMPCCATFETYVDHTSRGLLASCFLAGNRCIHGPRAYCRCQEYTLIDSGCKALTNRPHRHSFDQLAASSLRLFVLPRAVEWFFVGEFGPIWPSSESRFLLTKKPWSALGCQHRNHDNTAFTSTTTLPGKIIVQLVKFTRDWLLLSPSLKI